MPVTQEYLNSLSALWLSLIIGWKIVVWISGERKGDK